MTDRPAASSVRAALRHRAEVLLMAGLSLLKLWLVRGQRLQAIGGALHDDHLFLAHADSLLRGDWLGPFDSLTLIKGPVYPMWIAACSRLGIPLLLAQHLLYIAASGLLVFVLRRWVRAAGVRLALFAWLLFNPATFQVLRVLREGIYGSEILLVLACTAALAAASEMPFRRAAGWAAGAGLALAAFWLTREEGVWLVPSIGLLLGGAAWSVWRRAADRRAWRLAACALPVLIWAAAVLAVSAANYSRYGLFTVVELKSAPFVRGYSSLLRVRHAEFRRFLPVPKETRERIYEVSPAFAELKPHLEGRIGREWAGYSQYITGLDPSSNEIASAWFMFALREAVQQAGHYGSGPESAAYYERLAEEIDSACADGRLACGPRRRTLLPRWESEYGPLAWPSAKAVLACFLTLPHDVDRPEASTGREAELEYFRRLTHERLSPGPDRPLNAFRLAVLQTILRAYRLVLPWLLPSALVVCASTWFLPGANRELLVLNLALLGGTLARLALLAYMDLTAYPASTPFYLSPAYVVALPFSLLAWYGALRRRPAA